MNKSKYKVLAIVAILPFFLTGCGVIDAVVSFFRTLLLFGLIIGEFIWTLVSIIGLTNATLRSKRGTNVVTRFFRDGLLSAKLRKVTISGTIVLAVCVGIGFSVAGFWGLLFAIPPLAVIILGFVILHKSTKSEQRIKDARVVTKASLDVGAQTGTAVGIAAGTAIGTVAGCPQLGTQMGKAVGDVVSAGAANASANMQVEGAAHIDMTSANESIVAIGNIPNQKLFLEQARKTGIQTEGRTIEQIVNDVIMYAPQSRKANIPEGASKADIAMDILNAYTQQESQPAIIVTPVETDTSPKGPRATTGGV